MDVFSWSMAGGQQTGPPDDWSSHADSGNLWKIWSRFHYHSRACHRRDVPRYVRNDRSCGNIQPAGKRSLLLVQTLLIQCESEALRPRPGLFHDRFISDRRCKKAQRMLQTTCEDADGHVRRVHRVFTACSRGQSSVRKMQISADSQPTLRQHPVPRSYGETITTVIRVK